MFRMHAQLISLKARTITFPSFTNLALGWQLLIDLCFCTSLEYSCWYSLFQTNRFLRLTESPTCLLVLRLKFYKLSTLICFGSCCQAIWLAYFNLKTSIHNNLRLFGWNCYILYNTSPTNSDALIMIQALQSCNPISGINLIFVILLSQHLNSWDGMRPCQTSSFLVYLTNSTELLYPPDSDEHYTPLLWKIGSECCFLTIKMSPIWLCVFLSKEYTCFYKFICGNISLLTIRLLDVVKFTF